MGVGLTGAFQVLSLHGGWFNWCVSGYYRSFPSGTCVLCTNTLSSNQVWATSGLTDNQPNTCLTKCAYFNSLTTCLPLLTNLYIPTNEPGIDFKHALTRFKLDFKHALTRFKLDFKQKKTGFYESPQGTLNPCQQGYTSQRGKTTELSQCIQCLAPNNTMGSPCDFSCPTLKTKRGDECILDPPTTCQDTMEGYTTTSGFCMPTPLPWPRAGLFRLDVALTQSNLTYNYNAFNLTTTGLDYTFTHRQPRLKNA